MGFGQHIRQPLGHLLIGLTLLGWIPINTAADETPIPKGLDPDIPWQIQADSVVIDLEKSLYDAKGNVIITKGSRSLAADQVHFNNQSMQAEAEGNVVLSTPGERLAADWIDVNLTSETGTIHGGSLFLHENHFFITGDRITKTGPYTYTAERATLTTCDGDTPDWLISARDVRLTIEGYGTAKHAAFKVKKVPVMYSPYLVFPVKVKRQTGFLTPDFGTSSRKGKEFTLPFFWAINESSDATFYDNYTEKRGHRLVGEYRYILSDKSKGTLMLDGFEDQQVDEGGDSSDKWGYQESGTDILRPDSERYWFRMKHNQALPGGFTSRLDLDIVSDQDYLREFKRSMMGFNQSQNYFEKEFGRDLPDYDDPLRLNLVNLQRSFTKSSLTLESRWLLDARNGQPLSDTDGQIEWDNKNLLQKPMRVEYDIARNQILETPLFYRLDTEYVYFHRQEGLKGQRADLYPRVYLPLKLKNYLSVEPSAGLRETFWKIDPETDDDSFGDETFFERGIYDLKLDLSSSLERVFSTRIGSVERIKETLRPQVTYEYTPDQDQDNYPYFNSSDRIKRKNLITYGFTSTFTSRTTITPPKAQADIEPELRRIYNQFGRFKIKHTYDFYKAQENDPQPFGDLSGELDITPTNWFTLKSDAKWSVYDNQFTSHNVALSLQDQRGDRFFGEHRFNDADEIRSIYTDVHLAITRALSVNGMWERDLNRNLNIQYGAGFFYQAQCWDLDFKHTVEVEDDDRRYFFILHLHGLGKIGG
jgi:LPS-assembly protein